MNEFYKINFFLYHELKIKFLLKTNKIFFFFCAARTDSVSWFDVDHLMKIIKLNYFKIYTKTISFSIYNSIFKNINLVFTKTTTLFVNFDIKETIKPDFILLKPKTFVQHLHPKTKIISIKINNNLYLLEQFKNIKDLTYKHNLFRLFKLTQHTKHHSTLFCHMSSVF